MKNLNKIFLILVSSFIFTSAIAQNQKDEEMKAWMAYATPGDAQKMLANSTGDWKADVSLTMDPAQPPIKSKTSVHNEMIMGGRYLSTRYSGDMMGMPFEGVGTIGYDNGKKMYVSSWIDNMGTGIMYMEGKPGDDKRTVEFKGKAYEPMLGKDVMVRQVMTFIDATHQKMEMYMNTGEKEMKTMEINLSK